MLPDPGAKTVYRVDLEPLDPLIFGDSRPARAGVDHLQRDQDPSSLTVHGAIGKFLFDRSTSGWPTGWLGERAADVLAPPGPMASLLGVCLRAADGRPLFPRPRHLRCRLRGAGVSALDLLVPAGSGGGMTSCHLPEILSPPHATAAVHDEHDGRVWLSEGAMSDVLQGMLPGFGLVREQEVFRPEPRPGIEVDQRSGTVVEGRFFTRPYRRFAPGSLDPCTDGPAGYRAWFETLEPLPAELESTGHTAFMGGDRRRVRLCLSRDPALAALRDAVVAASRQADGGFFLYLWTPALDPGEVPAVSFGETRIEPVAAAVGRPQWVSGWDSARRQPRRLVSLTPAGSVFFYRWPEGFGDERRQSLVEQRWLDTLNGKGGAAGFGRTLVGVW